MKKIIILFIYLCSGLYALERESTLKMYHGIFTALSPKKSIKVYTKDQEYRDVFRHSKLILLSEVPEESDIILITNERTLNDILYTMNEDMDISRKPIMFVTNYHFLKISDKIVGAFYWRKGRSQLLFIKKRLEHYKITLPEEYQRFMIDEL